MSQQELEAIARSIIDSNLYMTLAEELTDENLDRGVEIFSRRSEAHGGVEWTPVNVRSPARHRLYRATALEVIRARLAGPADTAELGLGFVGRCCSR